LTAKVGVLSLVDDAHAAATELLDDAIVRDGLPDHQGQILRWRNGQVNEGRGVGIASKALLLMISIARIGRRRGLAKSQRALSLVAPTDATISLLHLKLIPPRDRNYSAGG
jgi:hypothetical protein